MKELYWWSIQQSFQPTMMFLSLLHKSCKPFLMHKPVMQRIHLRKAVQFFVVFLFCFFNSLFLIHPFNSLGYYLFQNKQKSIRWLFWGWKWSLSTLGRNDGGKNVAFEGIHRFMEACFHHWIEIRNNMVIRMLFAQTWKLVIWVRCQVLNIPL